MPTSSWNLGFHLRSPRKWLNDPNGLSFYNGRYRFFYQYNSQWPHASQKAWAQFSSPDLLTWDFEGVSIEPSRPEDRHGVYSGCCRVEKDKDGGERLLAYYTGNVIDHASGHNPQDVGHTYDSREAYQIVCESADGVHFKDKRVLLAPADYPESATRHVRDPFVFEEAGALWMLLGCRHMEGRGQVLLYRSDDKGQSWSYHHAIDSCQPFGSMWECPNLVRIDGADYLAFCPQGLPRMHDRWQNLWQAGYVPLEGRATSTTVLDERDFVEWDSGHDFYAPQIFTAPDGRILLVGWLGGFDRTYECAPDELGWAHCLTVPRELYADPKTGRLLQAPVREISELRREGHSLLRGTIAYVSGRHADVDLTHVSGPGILSFDNDLMISWDGYYLTLSYSGLDSACGREIRTIPVSDLRDLRVLIDGSVVEVFCHHGAHVLASRWFPEESDTLMVRSTFTAQGAVWRMEDMMSPVYETAEAPDIAYPGWNYRG